MNTHFPALARTAAASALIAGLSSALLVCAATVSHAQTTLFSTGFEASQGYSTTATNTVSFGTTAPGAIFGQASAVRSQYGLITGGPDSSTAAGLQNAVNATTVVNNAAATGTQSVHFNGPLMGNQSVELDVARNLVAGAGGSLRISTDMRVTNPSAAYGQWGVRFIREAPGGLYTVGAFGFVGGSVLASPDGTNLFAAINAATFTPYAATYNTFNNYALQMNFDQRTLSGFFNGTKVAFVPVNAQGTVIGAPVADMQFTALADNTVTYASFGEALFGTGESANFDNVQVSGINVTAAPEPATFALLGLGLCGAGVRIRRRKNTVSNAA